MLHQPTQHAFGLLEGNIAIPKYAALKSVAAKPTFACLYAIDPRVLKLCITDISTLMKPSTTATTTAILARFLGSNAPRTPASAHNR